MSKQLFHSGRADSYDTAPASVASVVPTVDEGTTVGEALCRLGCA